MTEQDVIELTTLDAKALRELCVELLAEVRALKLRVTMIEGRLPQSGSVTTTQPPFVTTWKDQGTNAARSAPNTITVHVPRVISHPA